MPPSPFLDAGAQAIYQNTMNCGPVRGKWIPKSPLPAFLGLQTAKSMCGFSGLVTWRFQSFRQSVRHRPPPPAIGGFRPGAAECIAPEFSPGRLPEMDRFDPNSCCCLHLPGMEKLPRGWQLQSPATMKRRNCRNRPQCKLMALQSPQERQGSTQQEMMTGAHHISVPTIGTGRPGISRVRVAFSPCAGDNKCLMVGHQCDIAVIPVSCRRGYVTMAWCQDLDPKSYNLTKDRESFGVLCCLLPGCRNYYKYLKKAFVPLQKVDEKCMSSCPR